MNGVRLRCAAVVGCLWLGGCGGSAQPSAVERPVQPTTAHEPAVTEPAARAMAGPESADTPRHAFLGRLLSVSRAINENLTPVTVGQMFSAAVWLPARRVGSNSLRARRSTSR
jgi:hypothetical protein